MGSHCGWGGVLESVTAGKPVACVPFFADQPANAAILVAAGIGELAATPTPFVQGNENNYRPHEFTDESIAEAVRKVATDPAYTSASLRAQQLGTALRGAEDAAREVELAAIHGIHHLLARDRWARRSGTNIWSGASFAAAIAGVCLAVGFIASLRRSL